MPGALRVEGARTLRRTMKAAGLSMKEMSAAHKKIGGIVARPAKLGAPRKTGRLAASVRPIGYRTATVIRAGYKRTPYAGPIHWGWPDRGIKPSFWITKAAQQSEPVWRKAYFDEVDQILNKIKGI